MPLTPDQASFIVERARIIRNRIAKAQNRVNRTMGILGQINNPTEQARIERLTPVLLLHENQPGEAMKLYDKTPPVIEISDIPDYTKD